MSDSDVTETAGDKVSALFEERRFRDAIEPAAEACRLEPERSGVWWNYSVALKHGHRWADCLEASDRAIALDPDDSEGMHWNAGIAATALGNWSRARAAWKACGIDVPAGDGPLEMRLGMTPVRISPADQPEVVYGERLDPCRARLISIPLPDSQHRYGDIVLHDGEPRGRRRVGQHDLAVFDELVLLEPSRYGTWTIEATCDTPEERDALVALFEDVDGAIEDWTESLVMLCAQCSLGEPHDHHDDKKEGWSAERRFGLALRDESELRRLRRLGMWWRRGVRDVTRAL